MVFAITVFALIAVFTFGEETSARSVDSRSDLAPAAVFPGTGAGPIPDGGTACAPSPGAPLNIAFNVTGIPSAPSSVAVDFTAGTPAHTFIGDLVVTLIAPNGTTHSIFGRTGATTATGFGNGNNLIASALYTFNNTAANNWWTVAIANTNVPAGSYRTSNSGGAGATNPMPNTDINAAFSGIPTSNGTWTLRFTDGCSADTGAIASANLTLTAATPVDAPNDFNADGKSDFAIVRADGAPLAEFMGANDIAGKDKVGNNLRRQSEAPTVGVGWWTTLDNGGSPARRDHGADTDFFLIGDVVGDTKDDLIIWRPGAALSARFLIMDSGTFTVTNIVYGQTGDDPTVGGDWNGDGKQDLSVYRDGTAGSPQSFFFWSTVAAPSTINYVPWGTDGDVAYTLDYDGDGKSDPAVQRNGGGGRGDHWIRQSSNGAAVLFPYGLSSDFVLPGDYDGDGRDDVAISRNMNWGSGTFKYFYIRESDGGGNPLAFVQWGIPGDFICQGDYDGDGITDLGVWRSNADPTQNFFYVRQSTNGALKLLEWGQSGDYPVNNWNVH